MSNQFRKALRAGTPHYAPWISDPDEPEYWTEAQWRASEARMEKYFSLTKDELQEWSDASWDESKHPRGQPENKGQFGPGGGGTSTKGKGAKIAKGKARKAHEIKRSAVSPQGASASASLAATSARRAGKKSGADGHPGEGYTKHAKVINGVIHTSDVEDAAKALMEHRKVELDQPRGVSIVLDRLAAIGERMIEAGEKAPTINLCNLSVKGSNLFCAGNMEKTRETMPQLDEEETAKFVSWLKDKGYEVKEEEQYASHLRATQNQLNGVKVAGIAKNIRAGKYDPTTSRTIISDDDYVLDGHHRWAAKVGVDSQDGNLTNDKKYPVSRIKIKITKLLEEAEIFTGGKGKKGVGEGTETAQVVTEAEKKKAAAKGEVDEFGQPVLRAKEPKGITSELKPVETKAKTTKEKMAEGRAKAAEARGKAAKAAKEAPRMEEHDDWDSYPDAEGSDMYAEGYIESLRQTSNEMAEKYGFPAEDIKIKSGYPRTVGGSSGGGAAACYTYNTQEITVFPMVTELNQKQLKPLLAHEINHHQYSVVTNDWRKEVNAMSDEERDAYGNETGELDKKKYPTAAALRPFALDRVAEHANEGKRVSPYAAEFWVGGDDKNDLTLATTETLAEVAHLRETNNGVSPRNVSQFWNDHFDAIDKLYRARKK